MPLRGATSWPISVAEVTFGALATKGVSKSHASPQSCWRAEAPSKMRLLDRTTFALADVFERDGTFEVGRRGGRHDVRVDRLVRRC